ncbi:MAG: urease accessory protein UreF [Rhodobacteraceae bacterium]|nr:urease accessory protein UreF [Paracoccaceae bacterium]
MSADLLKLTQWLSPAFPLGSFAYSHGLETAIAAGDVSDASTLHAWLLTVLAEGSGRSDAALLALSLRSGADHAQLSAFAFALCASAERRRETEEQGAAFIRTVNKLTGVEWPALALPVAVGRAAGALDIQPATVVALYLQAFFGNLVTIGVRHVPLGQTEGQGVLTALNSEIAQVAEAAVAMTLDDITNSALGADLAALRHETQDVRIFKT